MLSCCFDLARSQGRRELKAVSTVVTRVASRLVHMSCSLSVCRALAAAQFVSSFEPSDDRCPIGNGIASTLDSRGVVRAASLESSIVSSFSIFIKVYIGIQARGCIFVFTDLLMS